jgi:beta-glucosidase
MNIAVRSFMLAVAATAIAHSSAPSAPAAAPDPEVRWPRVVSKVRRNATLERRVETILKRMSLEEKVGQIIQPDISSVTPDEVKKYKFGSILAGGNSAPGGRETAPAREWLALADRYWEASRSASWSGETIPLMWGIDAVHGHANIVGATIFPQNIGLGATRNPALLERIGRATAIEMTVTGIDWDFSPTLAVVRDDRWGRAYEGFSEEPAIVRSYAGKMVEGLQGTAGKGFLGPGRVIATAKHFVGDGGTLGGKDQGDNPASPAELRDIHGAGYPPAIAAGVQAVMASFSSVRGAKTHGDPELLTKALKRDMGFDGILVGDWNAHGQVPGCSNTSCPASINAGLDMFMAPDSWKLLYDNTLAQARSGEIPLVRLEDAVRRILRVKLRAGLFEKGKPSSRPLAGRFELLGASDHRAVARQAVRESLVLLKNDKQILPLSPKANVLVAGDGADNIAKQSGGWTLTWQGTGVTNADFPNAQSIFAGIRETVSKAGGTATLSADGSFAAKPDVAIVVFGEDPYAEFVGDRPHTLEFSPADKKDLELMRQLRARGVPVVALFLSGRPMWVNPEINASDAFVAAFLPGSEGGGIADLLFRSADGRVRHDFKGRLSYSWPKRADQTPLNVGDRGYDPLFAFGAGRGVNDVFTLPRLAEDRPVGAQAASDGVFFGRGQLPQGWSFVLREGSGVAIPVTGNSGGTGTGRIRSSGVDRRAQEDARAFVWDGSGAGLAILSAGQPLDISREANGELSLVIEVQVDRAPSAPVTLAMECGVDCRGAVPAGALLRSAPAGQWSSVAIPLRCFAAAGADMRRISAPLIIETAGPLSVRISDVRIASTGGAQRPCPA